MTFRRVPGATVVSDSSNPVDGIIGAPEECEECEDCETGSGTETVTPNIVTAASFSVVGQPNTFTGALLAIIDNSDSTYIDATSSGSVIQDCYVNCGFSNLGFAAGRDILHFTIIARVSAGGGIRVICADTFTGVSIDPGPGGLDVGKGVAQSGGSMRDVRIGPFYRSGGLNFTVSQINALACRVIWFPSDGIRRIGKVSLEVTYA